MKKWMFLALFAIIATGTVSAQKVTGNDNGRKNDETSQHSSSELTRKDVRKQYFNLFFAWQTTYPTGDRSQAVKSALGVGFTAGRSFLVHKKPVGKMVFFGIDVTWVDVNFAMRAKRNLQGDLSILGFGPGIHIRPVGKLDIHLYARYNPTFTAFINLDRGGWLGYSSTVTTGGAVSWGVIGLGLEYRWSQGNYKGVKLDEGISVTKQKTTTSGGRVYVAFKF